MSRNKIGAHVSAAGGAEKAIGRAHEIGATCVQLFSGSPRVWKRTPLAEIQFDKVFSEQDKYTISPIFIHTIYLVNLCSQKPELIQKSRSVLEYDLKFCSAIRGAGVVVHLGSHQGRGWEAVREDLAELLTDILRSTPPDSTLLIENAAGQNGKVCGDLAEVRWLLDAVDSPRLGWCFDTCHAWAAGYGLGEHLPAAAEQGNAGKAGKSVVPQLASAEIDRLKLWDSLKCVHVNDSRDPFGAGRDRHDNLLEGNIPADDLQWFLTRPQLLEVPLVLEVPGIEGTGPDVENIERLKRLLR